MLDQLLGLILFVLGLRSNPFKPAVLGTQTAATFKRVDANGKDLALLKLMRPKFTPEEQATFQKERMKREENYSRLHEVRVKELDAEFAAHLEKQRQKDASIQANFESAISRFSDPSKQRAIRMLSDEYHSTVKASLTGMHTKLTSMLFLLDRIRAASGAVHSLGTDVENLDSNISSAQAEVVTALGAVSLLAETLPTSFTVTSEARAKEEMQTALSEVRFRMASVRSSFLKAHTAVGGVLSSLESITDAVEVGQWPVQNDK